MLKLLPIAALLLCATRAYAQVPGPPQDLSATVNGTTVTLGWSAPVGGGPPSSYMVEAAFVPGGFPIASLPVSGTSLTVPNVPNGIYFVRVRAVNSSGMSAPSNEVRVAVSGGCPAPPLPPDFTLKAIAFQGTLNWGSGGGCAPTSYTVVVGSGPGGSDIVQANLGGLLAVSAAAPPGVYYVRVIGTNAFGSAVSEELTARIAANAQTDTVRPNGAVAIDIVLAATGTYQASLVWNDPTIDLDLYLTTAGCTYPPTACLLAISDATGTNTEQVSWSVRAGETYRLWVDNFSPRTTSFTIFSVVGSADANRDAETGTETWPPAKPRLRKRNH
jgi:predicted phage tail protein